MDNEKKKILTSADIIELFNKKNIDSDWSFEGVNPSQTCKCRSFR